MSFTFDPTAPNAEDLAYAAGLNLNQPPADFDTPAADGTIARQVAADTYTAYVDDRQARGLAVFPTKSAEAGKAQRDNFKKVYQGIESLNTNLNPDQWRMLEGASRAEPDPQDYQAKAINNSYLESLVGREIPAEQYATVRDSYAQQHLNLTGPITDKGVYEAIRSRFQEDDASASAVSRKIGDVVARSLDTVGKLGESVGNSPTTQAGGRVNLYQPPTIQERDEFLATLPERTRDGARQQWNEANRNLNRIFRQYGPLVDEITRGVESMKDQADAESAVRGQVGGWANKLPEDPKERGVVLAMIGNKLSNNPAMDGNTLERVGYGIFRGVDSAALATMKSAQGIWRQGVRGVTPGDGNVSMVTGGYLEGQDKRAALDANWVTSDQSVGDLQNYRDLLQTIQGNGMDLHQASDNLLSSMAIAAAPSAWMIPAAFSPVGNAAIVSTMAGDSMFDAQRKSPDTPEGLRTNAGLASGMVQGAIEVFSDMTAVKAMTGKLPAFTGLLNKFGMQSAGGRAGLGFAAGLLGTSAMEYGEEMTQGATDLLFQSLASDLAHQNSEVDWGQYFHDWLTVAGPEQRETLLAVAGFGMVAGAGASFNHFKYGESLARNKSFLRANGLTEAEVRNVTNTTDLDEASKRAQAAFLEAQRRGPTLSDEDKSRLDLERKNAIEVLQARNTAAADAGMPIVTREKNSFTEEDQWVFTDPATGKISSHDSEEEALIAWRDWARQQDEDHLDTIQRAGEQGFIKNATAEGQAAENVQVEQSSKALTLPDVQSEAETEQKAAQKDLSRAATDIQRRQAQERIDRAQKQLSWLKSRFEVLLFDEGLSPAQAAETFKSTVVRARNFSREVMGRIAGYTVQFYRGATVQDIAEDFAEVNMRSAIDHGFADGEVLYDDIRRYEAATGAKIMAPDYRYDAANPVPLIEGFSKLARGVVLNEVRSGALPPAVAKWIQVQVALHAASVELGRDLATAGEFRQALAAGYVPARLHQQLLDSVGLDPAAQLRRLEKLHEDQVAAEAMDGFAEVSDELSGRLPHPETLRANNHPLYGEVRRIWESLKKPTRRRNKSGQRIDRTNEANAYFLPVGEMVDLDQVRQRINQRGFGFETPVEMLDALDASISYGKPFYGTESNGSAMFSLGSASGPGRVAENLNAAKDAAQEFINEPITNKDDGLVATLSKRSLEKMVSKSAVTKSISTDAHAFAVANLDALFEGAIRTHTGIDRDENPNIEGMHRYWAPITHGGETLLVKMTVKEFVRESEGNRIYSVEAVDVVKPAGIWTASISEDRRNYVPQAGFEEKLQQRINEVKGQRGPSTYALGAEFEEAPPGLDDPIPTNSPTLDEIVARHPDLKLSVSERKQNISVSMIRSNDPGKGKATAAMLDIVAYADRVNKTVVLDPTSEFGANKTRLIQFYQRFGFLRNIGKNKDFSISEGMYRPASGNGPSMFSLAGANARITQFQRDSLETAKAMAAEGKDSEQIRALTGWFPSKYDGKMRWEIPDKRAQVTPLLKILWDGAKEAREIKNITYRKDGKLWDVLMSPPNARLTSDLVTAYGIPEDLMRSLVPDSIFEKMLQHQGEDDLIGNDFSPAKRINETFQFEGMDAMPLDLVLDHPQLFRNYPSARDVMVRVDPKLGRGGSFAVMTTGEDVITIGRGDQRSTLLHEIQHWIQNFEGFAQGASPGNFSERDLKQETLQKITEARDQAFAEIPEEFKNDARILNRSKMGMSESQEDIRSAARRIQGNPAAKLAWANYTNAHRQFLEVQHSDDSAYGKISAVDQYRRTAGEIEARDVQARKDYTAEQLAAIAPYSSENIAKEDAIVMGQSGTAFSLSPDYGINHRPSEEGPPAHDLAEGDLMPGDVYDHPEWYTGMGPKIIRETMAQLKKVRNNPEGLLKIFRAGPKAEMNQGDWVTLSKEYARTHAMGIDPDQNTKVWVSEVKAQEVRWAMDDLAEFGYFGESTPAVDTGSTFALSTQGVLRLEEAIAKKMTEGPDERAAFYERLRNRLASTVLMLRETKRNTATVMTEAERERNRIQDALAEARAVTDALPASVRGKVQFNPAEIMDITSERGQVNALLRLIDRADEALEEVLRKEYRESFETLLDLAKPDLRQNKSVRGRLTPETQRLVGKVLDAVTLDSAQHQAAVMAKQVEIDELENSEIPDDAEAAKQRGRNIVNAYIEQTILETFGNFSKLSASELAHAYGQLQSIYIRGRTIRKVLDEARRAEIKESTREVIDSLPKVDQSRHASRTADKGLGDTTATWVLGMSSFHQVMERLFPKSVTARDFQERVRKADRSFTRARIEARERFDAFTFGAWDLVGGSRTRKRNRILADLTIRRSNWNIELREGITYQTEKLSEEQAAAILAGTMKVGWEDNRIAMNSLSQALSDFRMMRLKAQNEEKAFRKSVIQFQRLTHRGTPGPMVASDLEALYFLQLWGQEQYRPALDKHGFTEEVIRQIEAKLSPQAHDLADFLRGEYDAEWGRLNPVYSRLYGLDMPRIRNYAPGLFEHLDGKSGDNASLETYGAQAQVNAMSAGFTKTRTHHMARPKLTNALAGFWSHLEATEYFISYAELVRDARQIFRNPEVRRRLEGNYGTRSAALFGQWLDAIELDGNFRAAELMVFAEASHKLLATQSAVGLAFNVGVLIKQIPAAFGVLLEMPNGAAFKGLIGAIQNPSTLRHVWNSEAVQQRILSGISPEDRKLLDAARSSPSLIIEALELGRLPIAYADAAFTTLSGSVAYAWHHAEALKAGLSPEAAESSALAAAARVIERTAQPATAQDKSMAELTAKGFSKFMFMFKSDPRQKLAVVANAVRDIQQGKTGAKSALARKALYGWLLYGLANELASDIVAAMFRDDDDDDRWSWRDYLAAAIAGPSSSLPFYGQGFELLVRATIGTKAYVNSVNPADKVPDVIRRSMKLYQEIADGVPSDMSVNDMLTAAQQFTAGASMVAGAFDPRFAIVPAGLRAVRDAAGLATNAFRAVTPETEQQRALRLIKEVQKEAKPERDAKVAERKATAQQIAKLPPTERAAAIAKLDKETRRSVISRLKFSEMSLAEQAMSHLGKDERKLAVEKISAGMSDAEKADYQMRMRMIGLD